jgi:protein-histidine pros-kinase
MTHGDQTAGSASEGKFRGLLEAAPDAIVIVADDGRIDMINQQAELLFGYARAELLGESVDLLVPERFRGDHPSHRDTYAADPRTRPMGAGLELFGRRKDGSEFPAEISLAPIRAAGGRLVMTAIRDITERKRLERRMVEASRLKSEFLANMSHELRSPLNAIIGFAELMYRGKVGPVSAEHQEYLGDILASSRHLLQLINDVLDLTKVESGKMEFSPERVDVGRLAVEVRDVLRGLLVNRDLQVEIAIDAAVGPVEIDPARTRQILYNYLSNAIKFTPDGGTVRVRVRAEDDDTFRIDVEDTGVGIAPDQVSKLFVEFQQLDAGLAKRYPGTGLGLALTRRLAEALGGRVEVSSTLGAGSTFSVILPRRARDARAQPPPLPTVPTGSRTVLVVDDDRMALHLAAVALRDVGFRPLCHSDPEQAFAAAATEPLAAIVVDLLMPITDGFVLTARLREVVSAGVPVVAWTVKDLSREERARLRAADIAIVGKDASGAQGLVDAVRTLTGTDGPPR